MLILLLAVGGPLVALREVRLRQLTQDQKNESDRLRTETQWRLAQTFTERGIAAAEQADYGRALLWFAESIRASEGNSQNRDHQDRANRIRMANYAPFCPRLVRVLADTAQITFSPNGRRFLTLESDRKCRVWDLNPDVSKSTICCELNDVAKAWFSPDSRLMLAETPDGTVRAYDTATGKPAGPSLSGAIRDTNSVMSPTGEWIAASKGDSNPVQVQLHNVVSGQPIGEPFATDTLSSLVYSPDGRWIYGSANRAGTLWASSTGKPAVSLGHDAGEAYRAYFGPDGKCIITHKNDELRLWDLHSGQPIGHPIKQPADHTFSPDGRWLATANGQVVKLLNTETGAELVTLYHGDQVLRMLFSASSRHLVTSTQDRLVHVWDVPSGQPTGQPMQHPATIASLELTPDDRWIVTSTPGSLYIWELDSGELVARVRIHEAEGKLSPSGLHFALVTEGVIQLWELLAGHRIRHVDSEGPVITTAPITDAVVSRDGRMLVTSSWTGTAQVWDARSGQAIGAVLSHERPIVKLAISADGRLVATASWDHTVRLWHSSTGSAACAALRHRAPVTAVAFSDNGRWLVTAAGNEAQLWDMTGRAVGSSMIHRGGIYSVHFSSDSRALVTASSDNSARVWTAPDGTLIRSFGHEDQVVFAAFSPDNRKIVTSANGTASVWDIDSGKTLGNRIVHHAGIGFATFSPDGRLLATASRDNTARVWDAASGKPISKPLQHDDFVNWITFSPDGSQVLTASLDGTARLWQASTGDPLCPPLAHKQALNHAFFAGDPARVLTVDRTTIRSWHVGEPLLADGDTLSQWAESLVAAQLDPSGYTRNLSSGEWEGKAAVAPGALPGSDGLIYGRRRSLFCRSRSLDYAGAFKNDAAGIHAELATVLDTQRGAEMLAWRPPEPFQSASGSPAAHKDSPTLLNGAWHCPRLPDGDESVPAWANDQPAFDVVGFLNSRRPLGDSDTKFLLAMTTLKGETWYDCFRSASLRSKRGPTAIETAKEAVELIAEKLTDGQVPKDRELPELDEKLGHFNQFLDEIDQVTRDPKWVHVTGQTFESMLPAVQESRTILRILRVKVHRDVSRGRLNEAIDSCDIGLRLSLGLRRRGGAIQNLVSFAQDFVLCDAVSEILGSAALRVEHCDRLLELLRRAQTDDLDPMAEALKVEYIMLRNSGADFIPRLTEGSLTPAEFSAEWDMPALARMSVDALTRDFVVDTNRWYEIVAQLYSRPYTHDRAVALAAAIQEFGRSSNPIVREFVSQLLQMMRAAVRGDTRLNGYIALIAVQRWRSVHGEWPATLADGVGEAALTHVPTDLYSNQPLRYRVVDGQPVVYSVGSDQKDDGGIIDWNADQQPGDFLFRIRQLAANSRSDCAVFANPE